MPLDFVEAKSTAAEPVAAEERTATVESMLQLARERFKMVSEAEAEMRGHAIDDMKFSAGEQWPADIKSARANELRPCLTINRAPAFLRQITNEQRQQRPSIQVQPAGDGADQDTAEALQGVVRHIEQDSYADIAYDTGGDRAARMGWGFWRIVTEHERDDSFDQVIKIKKIDNSFSVYMDPAAVEPDKSDARFCFIVRDYTKEEYKSEFGESHMATLADWSSIGDGKPGWATKESVRVAEYYRVEHDKKTLVELENGETRFEDELQESDVVDPNGRTRSVRVRKVIWSKINAIEELETTVWPGRWIPVIQVVGEELDLDGKKYLAGVIRDYKDPQRRYNYEVTAETEMVALAPKVPYIGVKGQFSGMEQRWKNANVRSYPYLEYDPVSVEGTLAPPPQRQMAEPPIAAISRCIAQADNDMKAVTSLYDASLGERGPEQSGRAILARKVQGSIANLNFTDNLARAIRFTGRQIVELIPKIYDAARVVRIVAPDGTAKFVGIYNSNVVQHADAHQALGPKLIGTVQDREGMTVGQAMQAAVDKIYDVGVGTYDVTVDVGPSYTSRRQEAAASMIEFAKAFPQSASVIQDIVAGEMDWPGSRRIADRLKKALPPQLQDESDDGTPNMQQVKAQFAALDQQHQMLVQSLNEATDMIKNKRLELASKERIAAIQAQSTLLAAEFKAQSVEGIELLRQKLTDMRAELERVVAREDQLDTQGASAGAQQASAPAPTGGTPGLQ